MQFRDFCAIIDDIRFDELTEGVSIVQLINTVLVPEGESIGMLDTGLTLLGKYHNWSSDLRIKVNQINFNASINFIDIVKEIKQLKYSKEATRDSDTQTKNQLVMMLCTALLVVAGLKTCSSYDKMEAIVPEINDSWFKYLDYSVPAVEEK